MRVFLDGAFTLLSESLRTDAIYSSNGNFLAFFKKSPEQRDLKAQYESRMKELIPDEKLQRKLIPTFEAGCRRINPGEQFLVALQKPNVRPMFEAIEKITPTGVISGGTEQPADILIAATGFDSTFRPRFPIIGRGGVNLQDLWHSEPASYMGIGVSGFPNYLMFLGPNTPISNGSLMGESTNAPPPPKKKEQLIANPGRRLSGGNERLLHPTSEKSAETEGQVL